MSTVLLAPLLSERDAAAGTEGGIDPLGLAAIADRLGSVLVPGVRERQLHPRFLTAIAVSLAVCEEFEHDTVAEDGVSEPWQVFEWYLVEGLVRTSRSNGDEPPDDNVATTNVTRDELKTTRGVPGSRKARQALDENFTLSAKRYLRTPTVFGFHGVYRVLARTLGIEDNDTGGLGKAGTELVQVWSKERGLPGFIGTAEGPGRAVLRDLRNAVASGLVAARTTKSDGWAGWKFFREHLDLYSAGKDEAKFIIDCLLSHQGDEYGYRREALSFLISAEGRNIFKSHNSERAFHAALRNQASEGLRQLLDAIDCYEAFARLCQDAFDVCLVEMALPNSKVTASHFGNLDSVKQAAERVPAMFQDLLNRLEPFGESARLRESCGLLAEHCLPMEWARLLLKHHSETQQRKQPVPKLPWVIELDGGRWQIRSQYQRRYTQGSNAAQEKRDRYVHGYRTNSLWNFACDLKVVP